jgi:phosphoserine/homoserine phosphotransferase
MYVLCSDLEGVWVPEVWVNVAKKTGIEELKLTTRDINDYDVLMKRRLKILKEYNLKLKDIQNVISNIDLLEGAREALDRIRSKAQIIIVSDTFIEFADPFMEKLGRPLLMCHSLTVDAAGNIIDYNLRQKDSKRHIVEALQKLNYKVIAFGDSYNDVSMMKAAEYGILFRPPQNVINDCPQFPVVTEYPELNKLIETYLNT